MNILGVNPSHHGSVCLLQDGKIKYFIQEERLTREKYQNIPLRSFIDILSNYDIDYVTWGTPSIKYSLRDETRNIWSLISKSIRNKNTKIFDFSDQHHKIHAASAFYNSGFNYAISIVIDGMGSNINGLGCETETIFECGSPYYFDDLFKNLHLYAEEDITLSRAYEATTMHLGWDVNEAGKTMGLSSYGKENKNLPPFIKDIKGNPDVFTMDSSKSSTTTNFLGKVFMNEKQSPQLKLQINPKEWHHNESKITSLEKDIAWKIQNETQELVGNYVEKVVTKYKENHLGKAPQICCAGGYFLNCVTNYYLVKRFPKVKFYFEPIANDAGTSIGAAKLLWHKLTDNTKKSPLKSLYLGKQYSKEQLLEGIKKYVDN